MKNDGGPAFPPSWRNAERDGLAGMSLRDWFAGQALQGIIACFKDHSHCETVRARVEKAYDYADAMLAERSKS